MMVNMYRELVPDFYPICVNNIVKESYSGYDQARQQLVYNQFIELLKDVDWKRKRYIANAKEVIVKIQQF